MLIGELSLSSRVGQCLVAHTDLLRQNIVWVHRTTLHHSCVDLSKNRNRRFAHMFSPVYNNEQTNMKINYTLFTCYRYRHLSPLTILSNMWSTFLKYISLCRSLHTAEKCKWQNQIKAQVMRLTLNYILIQTHFLILIIVLIYTRTNGQMGLLNIKSWYSPIGWCVQTPLAPLDEEERLSFRSSTATSPLLDCHSQHQPHLRSASTRQYTRNTKYWQVSTHTSYSSPHFFSWHSPIDITFGGDSVCCVVLGVDVPKRALNFCGHCHPHSLMML